MSPSTSRQRVLILTPQSPYPPHQGTSIRNYNLLIRLAPHAEITLVTFVDADQPDPTTSPLREHCQAIYAHPVPLRTQVQRLRALLTSPLPDMAHRLESPPMHETVQRLAREQKFDVLLVEGIEMAPYMFAYLAAAAPDRRPRVIFDDHNAEYILQKRAFLTDVRIPARWHAALYSLIQWIKLRRYEARVCREADHVIVVSEADEANIQRLDVPTPVTVLPNGVDIGFYRDYESEGRHHVVMPPESLVFTGKMDFRPNVDAALWFVKHVWPRVRDHIPNAHVYFVGRSPHPRLLENVQSPGVFITGAVPDVRPYIAQAGAFIVPLRVGGGTRLKILEAMAMGKAVVSTRLGAEGYPVESGRHLLVADNPAEFAQAVIRVLQDTSLRQQLGREARAFVEQHYDWDVLFPRLLKVLEGRNT